MWEIFMFVNPFGSYCLKTESTLIDYVNGHDIKSYFNFIGLTNFEAVNQYIETQNLDGNDLQLRNQLMEDTYDAILTYKAASFQGKKKARSFLMGIQNEMVENGREYNLSLVSEVAEKADLNFDNLMADKNGQHVKTSWDEDKKLANDIGVSSAPSTVIIDYDNESSDGILIENCNSQEELVSILDNIYGNNFKQSQKSDHNSNIIQFKANLDN